MHFDGKSTEDPYDGDYSVSEEDDEFEEIGDAEGKKAQKSGKEKKKTQPKRLPFKKQDAANLESPPKKARIESGDWQDKIIPLTFSDIAGFFSRRQDVELALADNITRFITAYIVDKKLNGKIAFSFCTPISQIPSSIEQFIKDTKGYYLHIYLLWTSSPQHFSVVFAVKAVDGFVLFYF